MIELNRKVRFTHPDYSYTYTEYLLGSVGLKVNADIRVDVHWETEDINMEFVLASNTIERRDGGSFKADGFQVGDGVTIVDTVSNNTSTTITAFNDDFSIMTVAAVLADEVANSCTIHGTTTVTSMDFYPNKVENSNELNLIDLTDRETEPHYFADSISTDAANPTVMTIGTNSKGWVTPADSATIYRLSFTNYIQTFVISHTFTITPIYIIGQLKNLQHGLAPASGVYQDRFTLKYVYSIDARYSAFDPNIAHTTDGNVEFPKGQVGWFNEFVNGRPSIWNKSSIRYYDNATGAGLNAIDYCKTVDVDAILQCQAALNETKYILHVMYLPTNEERYVNTLTDWKTNFIYERAVLQIGAAAVQGENTGDYHFLKNVTATLLSGNRAQFDFQIDFSTVVADFFDTQSADNLNYLIFITASKNLTVAAITQTAVIMDVNVYECNRDDATLFQIIDEVQFFEYPHCNGNGYSSFSLLPMDTVVMKMQFHVKQGTELDPILLNKISASIVAVKQNEVEEFPLESFTINTAQFLPNCDNIQELEFEQDRDFIIPTGDCRNQIRLFRMPTLDITGYSAYEFIYPFKVRWEEWRTLSGANRCFPTPTQNWMVYANQTGWTVKFSINAEIEQRVRQDYIEAYRTEFEHITWGTIKEPCDIPYDIEFNTFDDTGAHSFEELIATDTDTYVEATITGDFNGYTVDQLYGILTLDAWGIGGVAYSQEIGTKIPVDENGVWYGTGSTLMATLTKVSNSTLKLSAFIDYEYLPNDTNQFILSARIGYYEASASSSGATCLNEVMVDSFTCGELEIIKVNSANVIVVRGSVKTQEARDVFVDNMILTYVAGTPAGAGIPAVAAHWTVSGGTIDDNPIASGTVGGTIIKYPPHPYTDANVGDTMQGNITGTLYSSITEITGIGDMQIGCTFFVS